MLKTLTAAVLAALILVPAGLPLAADDVKPHPGGWIQAEWLKGRPVVNATGKEMGKIEEVWIDPKDGRVREVVVGAGGFLGIRAGAARGRDAGSAGAVGQPALGA